MKNTVEISEVEYHKLLAIKTLFEGAKEVIQGQSEEVYSIDELRQKLAQ
ncbi:hypothetical protein HON22_00910 [Candidatus Peregrinibacteria bacterium]|jgi:hypothetical protein|nr:hypothetical protein [Candidatus Peregrinibacteria bacterium]